MPPVSAATKHQNDHLWLTQNALQPSWEDHSWVGFTADDWHIDEDNDNRDFIATALNHVYARNVSGPYDLLLHVSQALVDWRVYSAGSVSLLYAAIIERHGDRGEAVLLENLAECKKELLREGRERKKFIEQLASDVRERAESEEAVVEPDQDGGWGICSQRLGSELTH